MHNLGIALLKIVALAGGAVAGAIISRWVDEALQARADERPDYHKTRYAQGLTPVETPPVAEEY
jgi:hypothetical protein